MLASQRLIVVHIEANMSNQDDNRRQLQNKDIELRRFLKLAVFIEPILNADTLFLRFNGNNTVTCADTAFVIEELHKSLRYPLSLCQQAKHNGILHESRRKFTKKVHIIMPSDFQIYHVEGFEKHCHYSIRTSHVGEFRMICRSLGLETKVYSNEISHHTDFICVQNNVLAISDVMNKIYEAIPPTALLVQRNSNFSITYGYSGRNREAGGPPVLTKCSIAKTESETLLPLLLHMLCELTADRIEHRGSRQYTDPLRINKFARRLGENFGFQLKRHNIFEGVDCSLRSVGLYSESLLAPHCDDMNDWRPHSNYCSVAKAIITDEATHIQVYMSIIAYSRREIGDYLYGPGQCHDITQTANYL